MDPIKEAFSKVKSDIDLLKSEVEELKLLISNKPTNQPTHSPIQPTEPSIFPTPKLTEPYNHAPEALKSPFTSISIGNRGVPTNQPTNQQTNQRTGNEGVAIKTNLFPTPKEISTHKSDEISHLARLSEILKSLDDLKKEVRIKFKRLTDQEMTVFSAIYEYEENGLEATYESLSKSLSLTEISIRDYVRKLIEKGIPVEKTKQNNKKIILSVSPELKKVASLATISQLRNL